MFETAFDAVDEMDVGREILFYVPNCAYLSAGNENYSKPLPFPLHPVIYITISTITYCLANCLIFGDVVSP